MHYSHVDHISYTRLHVGGDGTATEVVREGRKRHADGDGTNRVFEPGAWVTTRP